MASLLTHRLIHSFPLRSSSVFTAPAMSPPSPLPSVKEAYTLMPKWESQANALFREGPMQEALREMDRPAIAVDPATYASLLQVCANKNSLIEGKQVHAQVILAGFDQNMSLGAKLVAMYSICGNLGNARLVFNKMCRRNVVLWNAIIEGYAKKWSSKEEAIRLYYQMQRAGIEPDNFTFTLVLKVCAGLSALQEGKEIHHHIVGRGVESDVVVGTALLNMYAKCGSVDLARQLFDKMSERDMVSWNAMIVGYAQNGCADEALMLFHQMQTMEDVKPDLVTMVSVLSACAHLAAVQQGMCIHASTIRRGFESHVSLGNSLVDMYAKSMCIGVARQVFDKMPDRDVVSWNSMIAGYAKNGYDDEAIGLFLEMQRAGVESNSVTVVSVLPACARLIALQQSKRIHAFVIRSGLEGNVSVGNALLDVYLKCGLVEDACQLFDKMSERNVVSWSVMISGYGHNGYASEALSFFHQMQLANVKPNVVTLISVLPVCAHVAALEQAKLIHAYIIRSGYDSDVSVGTAIITMYAKCGSLDLALHVFDKMSKRDAVSWSAMIMGLGMHGHGEAALSLFSQMQQNEIKPDHVTFVGVLSACSHAGLVNEGLRYFNCMKRDYRFTPKVEHYACMVDLLGRAGHLDEAHNLIKQMPLEPDATVWGALLGACRIYSNIELGECASEHLIELQPKKAENYVALSNIYAAARRWHDVAKVRSLLKDRGLKKNPGCSWLEIKNRVYKFFGGDKSHPQSEKIYAMLEILAGQMEEAGYMPDRNLLLHDEEYVEKD